MLANTITTMSINNQHTPRRRRRGLLVAAGVAVAAIPAVGAVGLASLTQLVGVGPSSGCQPSATPASLPPGPGTLVGASEYGPPGVDPTVHNADGAYARLEPGDIARLQSGGSLFAELQPLSLLRVTASTGRSVIARVADWGQGGGAVDGYARAVDLWWQTADLLGLPGTSDTWTGLVRIAQPPATGSGNLLAQTPAAPVATGPESVVCAQLASATLTLTPGQRAQILPDGSAAAPADAPPAVKAAIAAANQIHTAYYQAQRPEPLNPVYLWYDCSASADYVLYHAGLDAPGVTVDGGDAGDSTMLETFGQPGPGQWITVYANSTHAFLVIAGLAFDTADYGGPDLPAGTGPRWRQDPTGNLADGLPYTVRHPPGL